MVLVDEIPRVWTKTPQLAKHHIWQMRLETPKVSSGWKAVDFTLKDPDGKEFRMRDFLGGDSRGLVLAFLCNHCPYVKALAHRLAEDARELAGYGISMLGIMSNDYGSYPEDAPEKMKVFAEQHGFSFPYVVDEAQEVARAYGAVCTPDFFGFNGEGELMYRGRLDDARMREGIVEGRVKELVLAMRRIAETGQGPEEQFPSVGCSIKWSSS